MKDETIFLFYCIVVNEFTTIERRKLSVEN